ncbi:hypothetical protein C7S18_23775 (plasmid) [Ahniella affigens]|uniref:Uncharacterized protein n=2 Tax=Ahniella affigens TaxID=2021234 RepID=A0A2P1PZP9_9GAMM|nr:hypothetical protein C7S18_23775 [Ahniella affigens]
MSLAAAILASDAFVIRLDGREYAMSGGSVLLSSTGVLTLQSPNALVDCRRANGQALVAGPGKIVYDGLGRFLYLQSPEFVIQDDALVLQSTTGDIACANGVASERLFDSSFE